MLKGKCVVLGVTGSIAAYKIAYLASALVKQHADVHVIMTENATNFINPITFETLTSNKCLVDTFDRNFQFNVEHVALAKRADIFMVAPASANVIGKMANGIADDMLTTTILAAKCPKYVSPAMNTNMFENPIVQDNIKKLEHYGFHIIDPASGYLACGDTGAGKMPEPETLLSYILRRSQRRRILRERRFWSQPDLPRNPLIRCATSPTILPARWAMHWQKQLCSVAQMSLWSADHAASRRRLL